MTFKICLADSIPFLTKQKKSGSLTAAQKNVYDVKRKLQWSGFQKKAKANITTHYAEIKASIAVRDAL